jgi:phosphoribosyl-ATP pyrophosphohydrolase/phosphoribosyl-AMP cyclohydrolase
LKIGSPGPGLDRLFAKGSLIPAIVQDWVSGRVHMLGYMNREALERTLSTGRVTFFSRSKNRLWEKGETSGNGLLLVEIRGDCDDDTLLVLARPEGPTCHTGALSCFDVVSIDADEDRHAPPFETWADLMRTVQSRRSQDPGASYTASLLSASPSRILKKVSEETAEMLIAALSEDPDKLAMEWADLFYHVAVALERLGVPWEKVMEVLESRRGIGGLEEKRMRDETDGKGEKR